MNLFRLDRVVPFAVEGGGSDIEIGHVSIADLDPFGVWPRVDLRTDLQARLGRGVANEVDYHFMADPRSAAPVLGDVTEHSMFYLVPLARTGWEVANGDAKAEFCRELLKRHLPCSRSVPVAAATVCGDQQLLGIGVRSAAHVQPPCTDGLNGKRRRVVVNANAYPAVVPRQIVDAVWDRLAAELAHVVVPKIVYLDSLRLTSWPPLASRVLEFSDEFLLLRVDGNHGIALCLEASRLPADVSELRITVGVLAALSCLSVALQTVPALVQQARNGECARRVPSRCWGIGATRFSTSPFIRRTPLECGPSARAPQRC